MTFGLPSGITPRSDSEKLVVLSKLNAECRIEVGPEFGREKLLRHVFRNKLVDRSKPRMLGLKLEDGRGRGTPKVDSEDNR